MAIKIYNTLTRQKDEFVPAQAGNIKMFVCGPTVYNYIHIGNAMSFVAFDVIAKYFRYRGFNLRYIQNITDVDDRIIEESIATGMSCDHIAEFYTKEYLADMKSLGVDAVDEYLPAMKYIPQIISQIQRLVDKGVAYVLDDGVYYNIDAKKDYGKLSNQDLDQLNQHRIEGNDQKKNPGDFVIWKFHKPGEPKWDSPWGEGRPGWHIEDTAITETVFGPQYDVHGGGIDLIFPHHEGEIAIMESVSEKIPFVRYWLHNGHLRVDNKKMSKSENNFHTAREVLQKYDSAVMRYFYLSNHYRIPLNFTFEGLDAAKNSLSRLHNFMRAIEDVSADSSSVDVEPLLQKAEVEFEEAMDDDFETSKALAAIFGLVREVNAAMQNISKDDAHKIKEQMMKFNKVLGVLEVKKEHIPDEILDLVKKRDEERSKKNWKESDRLRDEILGLGFVVKDTPEGTKVHRV